MAGHRQRVAQRLEQIAKELLTAAARQHSQPRDQRDRRRRQLFTLIAPALQRRAEHLRDRDAEEGRRHVRPIINVLIQQPS